MDKPIHRFKAEFFKVLAHPMRLAILEYLRTGEKSVNELQVLLATDQPSVSQQLARLRNGNLLLSRKDGTTVYYSVRDPLIFDLMDVAREILNNDFFNHETRLQELKAANVPQSSQSQTST
jgi:DNA-binding transcriptional ArsR family regulator